MIDHPVEIALARDGVGVGARPACRDAERQPVTAQELHGAHDLGVGALPAPCIGGRFGALGADGGYEVRHADHVLAEFLIDERGVGKAEERAVRVLLANANQVAFAHHRLAAGVDVDMGAKLTSLVDDRADVVIAQVERMPVLSSPTARAVQVAGARRVEQDRPRNVALLALA